MFRRTDRRVSADEGRHEAGGGDCAGPTVLLSAAVVDKEDRAGLARLSAAYPAGNSRLAVDFHPEEAWVLERPPWAGPRRAINLSRLLGEWAFEFRGGG